MSTGSSREFNSNICRYYCLQRRLFDRLDQSWFLRCLQRRYITQRQQSIRILRHHRKFPVLPPCHRWDKIKE